MDSNNSKSNKPSPSNSQIKRKRARQSDGKFEGGAELNLHVESTDIAESLSSSEVDYSVRQKIDGPSSPTAGKYGKKPKVRPTFGKITTTYN